MASRRGSHEHDKTKLSSSGRLIHAEVPIIVRSTPNGNLKPMRFVSLHHHSTFSYLDGYQLPEAHVRRATELQMGAMAMTEHGNIDSHVKFEAAATATGVKPIFGCEVYTAMGKEPTQRKFHLTLIARNATGYQNLLQIVTQSWRDFYYEPTVTWQNLVEHREGLFVLSGCQGSMLACYTVGGKGVEPRDASYRRGLEVAKAFKRVFGGAYFIEVQAFPELEPTRRFAHVAPRLARAVGARLVATMDVHYTELAESEVQQILHNLRPGEKRTLEEQARDWGYAAPLCPPPNDRSIYRRLRATGLSREHAIEAIVSTEEIAQACDVELPKLPMVKYPGTQEELDGLVQQSNCGAENISRGSPESSVDMRVLFQADSEEGRKTTRITSRTPSRRRPLKQRPIKSSGKSLQLPRKLSSPQLEAIQSDESGSAQSGQRDSKNTGTSSEDPWATKTQEELNLAIWRESLKLGWYRRGLHLKPEDVQERYRQQLRHEMDLIESKHFVDYFLLVAAGIVYAKDRGVPVGPARGSAAASIAAWLLRITEVDPLRPEFNGLLRFERFIDITRVDLPDIDIDLPVEARPMVRAFYERLLGPGCVNNVGTFVQYKGKNSLDDIARVFNVPRFEVERVKDFLIERSSGDLRASSTVEDTVEQFPQAAEVFERHPELRKSQLLEGNYKGIGVHAAGLVLSNQPITNVTSMMEREVPKGSGNLIQCIPLDKEDAERQGLLKIDYLALDTMSMLWKCLEWTGMSLDDLYAIPLDDPAVYDLFQRNDVIGVFTFDGKATRYVNATLKPENFAEIMDAIAVARPGPLHNGAARAYAEVKQGRRQPEAAHPALEPYLASTKYQIVYQEQILNICRDIGSFDAVGVADIRRIIARKKGEQAFAASKTRFFDGARNAHRRLPGIEPIPENVIEWLWGSMITSGAYAFNAAHCAAYGMISVHSAWFKAHHPAIFYAAALHVIRGSGQRARSGPVLGKADATGNKLHALLRDAKKHDIVVRPPHPRASAVRWKPMRLSSGRLGVRAGFEQIHGIGARVAAAMEEYRAGHDVAKWEDYQAVKGIGPKTIEAMKACEASDDPFGAYRLTRDIERVKRLIVAGDLGDHLPAPTHNAQGLPVEAGRVVPVVWLGTILNRNVRDIFELNRAKFGEELDPSSVKDPHLNEWCLMTGEDESDQLLLKIDRWHWPAMKTALFNFRLGLDLLLVEGVRPRFTSSRQIKIKRLWVIEP